MSRLKAKTSGNKEVSINQELNEKINKFIEENLHLKNSQLIQHIKAEFGLEMSPTQVANRKSRIKKRNRKKVIKEDEKIKQAVAQLPPTEIKELLAEHVAVLPLPESIIDELKKTQTYTIRNMLEIIQKLRIRFEISDISDRQLLRTSEVLANINEKLFSMIQKLIDDAENAKGSGDKIVINLYNEIINHVASDMKQTVESDFIDIEVEEE